MTNERIVVVKQRFAGKLLFFEKQRKPMRIIGPHARKRELVHVKPLRPHLVTFFRLPVKVLGAKHVHLENFGVAGEFKFQDSVFLKRRNFDPRFFLNLAPRRLLDRFTWFTLAAETVPFPRPESALLHPKQDHRMLVDKWNG